LGKLFDFGAFPKMGIQNFPAALQPAIQQNMLVREFEDGLMSRMGYRNIAEKVGFPVGIGETLTKTKKGLKTPVTTPLTPSSNTNFDNGLTPNGWGLEQYTMTINMFGDTIDLNMVTERVGIAGQFLQNARTNGIQAMQSRDRLARNALFGGDNVPGIGGYLGGNTRVRTTLGAAGTTVAVDDIRGFAYVISATGQPVNVGNTNGMTVTIGAGAYTLIGTTTDMTNVSTAPGGRSGSLVFSANVAVGDGTAGQAVTAATAPLVLRPNGRATTAGLVAPVGTYGSQAFVPGDQLTMNTILSGVAQLRQNNVDPVDGRFNYYCDDAQLLGLFRDQDFKLLYRGDYGSDAYVTGQIIELLGVRFIPTTEAPQQASLGAGAIHRGIMLGQGALVEGTFEGTAASDIANRDEMSILDMVDGIAMITRPPMDRLQQIIAQSWYWIGGYSLPTDATATTNIIPTASNAYLKRGIVIESL
jgi:hypothetical protein